MRRFLVSLPLIAAVAFIASLEVRAPARLQAAATVQAPYNSNYTYFDLGSVPGLPASYGGLTILPSNTNKLLIGGTANNANGRIYSIDLVRDSNGHITGFSGTASLYSWGAYNDGTVMFGPGGVLFVTEYNVNRLGQIKPGVPNTAAYDKDVNLTTAGVASSVGSMNIVPAGFPGAGSTKIWSYSSGGWYNATLTPDGSGTYDVTGVTLRATSDVGPEGFIFIPPGSPIFAANSILVSEYDNDQVTTYTLDSNGDINVGSRQVVLDGLAGAEGAFIDPVTGDFLFSTFFSSNSVSELRGFASPNATPTSTPTATATGTRVPTAVPTQVIRQNVGGAAAAVVAAAAEQSKENREKAAASAPAQVAPQISAPSTGTGITPPNTGDGGVQAHRSRPFALEASIATIAVFATLALWRLSRRGA